MSCVDYRYFDAQYNPISELLKRIQTVDNTEKMFSISLQVQCIFLLLMSYNNQPPKKWIMKEKEQCWIRPIGWESVLRQGQQRVRPTFQIGHGMKWSAETDQQRNNNGKDSINQQQLCQKHIGAIMVWLGHFNRNYGGNWVLWYHKTGTDGTAWWKLKQRTDQGKSVNYFLGKWCKFTVERIKLRFTMVVTTDGCHSG